MKGLLKNLGLILILARSNHLDCLFFYWQCKQQCHLRNFCSLGSFRSYLLYCNQQEDRRLILMEIKKSGNEYFRTFLFYPPFSFQLQE